MLDILNVIYETLSCFVPFRFSFERLVFPKRACLPAGRQGFLLCKSKKSEGETGASEAAGGASVLSKGNWRGMILNNA